MEFPYGVTVTVVSSTTTRDQYGDETVATSELAVPGCAVAPRSSTEGTDRTTPAVITGLTVYMPAGTTLDADDLLRIDGRLYSVEGEPGVWRSPFSGWDAGLEVAVTRWEQT